MDHRRTVASPTPDSITGQSTSTYEHVDSARSATVSTSNEDGSVNPATDPNLRAVLDAWDGLPEAAQQTITAIVAAHRKT